MLSSLIIVFREVLEAGLIVGVVLAATVGVPGRGLWTAGGAAAGIAGACLVAAFADALYSGFSGSGQEVFNAAVLGLAVLMLGWHNVWMARHGHELAVEMRAVGHDVRAGTRPLVAVAVVVAVAVLREGAEVVLFLYGIAGAGDGGPVGMLAGSAAGLGLGAAVAAALYLGLLRIPARHLFAVTTWLITLLAAGMASQAAALLNRAGYLPALVDEIWDTSGVLRDDSLVGMALRTLVGYSDRPSAMQFVAYGVTLAAIAVLTHRYGRAPATVRHAPLAPQGSHPAP